MSETDVLLTLAEVSVAFVGFSALVVVFRGSGGAELGQAEAERVKALVGTGLGALLFSVLPFAFFAFGFDPTTTWRSCSGVQVVIQALGATSSILGLRRARARTTRSDVLLGATGLIVLSVLLLNALAIGFEGSFGPYLLGVMWTLGVSAFFLATVVTRRAA